MSPDEARLKVLENRISQHIQGFRLGWKDKAKSQRTIGALLFCNRRYMTDYVSTFYPVVYWPTEKGYRENPWGSFKILAHEYVHLSDAKRHGGWFSFSYIMPHWLVLLSLFSFLSIWMSNWWLMSLVATVFALPWPALWRMRWELRGYTMTLAVNAWKHGGVTPETLDWIVKEFTSGSYYFMWPFKNGMRKRLERKVRAIHNGDVMVEGVPFQHVKGIIDASDESVIEAAQRIK